MEIYWKQNDDDRIDVVRVRCVQYIIYHIRRAPYYIYILRNKTISNEIYNSASEQHFALDINCVLPIISI